MEEQEVVFNEAKIHEIENAGEARSLDDLYVIEDIVIKIKNLTDRIDFYKDYKKKKATDVDREVEKIKSRVEFLKFIILKTLQTNKEKNLTFPGTCRVATKKAKSKWVINNEEKLIELLISLKEDKGVVKEVKTKTLNKKEVYKLLSDWKKSGKIEQLKDYVEEEEGKPSISITYLEKEEKEIEKEVYKKSSKEDFDTLDAVDS